MADVRAQMFRQVMLHEVGHTLGLRHNFAGSFDAFNFRPEYWELRAADGTVEPRHVDPETPEEIAGRIHEFEYSSIMDYAGLTGRRLGGPRALRRGRGQVRLRGPGRGPDARCRRAGGGGTAQRHRARVPLHLQPQQRLPSVLLWYNDGSMLELHYTQFAEIAGNLEARKTTCR